MTPGVNAVEALCTVDPVEGFVDRLDPKTGKQLVECEFLPESSAGIEILRHPAALLEQEPKLWSTWFKFRSGVARQLTLADRAQMSDFEVDAWGVLVAAELRREKRQRDLSNKPPAQGETPAQRLTTLRALGGAR